MRKNQVLKVCIFCKTEYSVKASRSSKTKYCSNQCKGAYRAIILAGRPMPNGCKKEKPAAHSRLGIAKICGHLTAKGRSYCAKCREILMGNVSIKCANCGNTFMTYKSASNKYKCCSYLCRNAMTSKRQKGDLSHLWRGGLTDQNRILRNSSAYSSWRNSVFSRDNYTCVTCGVVGGKLCADHIKSWSLYPALRFDVSNGRTMCYPCHAKTDNFGYRAVIEANKYKNKDGSLQLCLI